MSEKRLLSRRDFLRGAAMTAVGVLAASCAQPTPQVIEKPVTVVVEKAVPVEKEVVKTVVVEKPVEVEKEVVKTVVVEKPVEVEKVVKETVVREKVVEVEKVVTATPTPVQYKEAPMLAELVKAGKLPPVAERLPEEPYVAKPTEYLGWKGTTGKYGGTWRMATRGPGDGALWERTVKAGSKLIEWDPDFTYGRTRPSIAKSWEVSPDGRVFTFHIRKGIKWSDGEPFTTADIQWWYDSVAMNKTLSPNFPSRFKNGTEPAKLEVKDDFTFTFTFQLPNGFFLWDLARPGGDELLLPSHYLKQYHADFVAKDKLDKMVKDAGYNDWGQLFGRVNATNQDNQPERPMLWPWIVKIPLGAGPQIVLERNPYYFAVDELGQQLPYIDKVVLKVHESTETMLLDAISGLIDAQSRFITGQFATFDGIAMVQQNQEKGDYHLAQHCNPPGPTGRIIPFNMTIADPVKRELFRNKDFRRAMSHAINREELWTLVSRGLAEFDGPKDPSPLQQDEVDQIWKDLAVYDPDKANELLDKIGLTKRDKDGFRLGPDGKPLIILVETVADWPDAISELEMVINYWKAVGINATLKAWDRPLFQQRRQANECEVACHGSSVSGGGAFLVALFVDARMQAPVNWESDWGPLWWQWYNSEGKEGEEPPPEVKEAIEIYKQVKTTVDLDKQIELFRKLLRMQAENIWQIRTGPVWLPRCSYFLVKNNLRNVPPEFPYSWWYPHPAPTQTYMWYFDPPQRL